MSKSLLSIELILVVHVGPLADLFKGAGEEAMPEEHHLFLKRAPGVNQAK